MAVPRRELDAETLRVARDNAPELLAEILADHDAAAAQANEAAPACGPPAPA